MTTLEKMTVEKVSRMLADYERGIPTASETYDDLLKLIHCAPDIAHLCLAQAEHLAEREKELAEADQLIGIILPMVEISPWLHQARAWLAKRKS